MSKKLSRWICAACAAVLILATNSLPARALSLDPGFIPQSNALELVNLDTGDTIYSKNANARLYQASTTKVMTFIVASELIKDPKNTMVTISENVQKMLPDRSYVSVQLAVGERMSALNLMYCMMLPSGNDAAIALAYYAADGNMQQFIQKMNQKAKELGCTQTNYTNVFGKEDKNHYTTANDLKKVYRYADTLPNFKQIASTASYTVPKTNCTAARKLTNSNELIQKSSKYYYQPCTNGKTGTSDKAGYCLASTASEGGSHYLCIAMDAPSEKNGIAIKDNGAFKDSRQLYEWAFDSLKSQKILTKGTVFGNVTVVQAKGNQHILPAVPSSDYNAMLPTSGGKISTKVSLPKSIHAPVKMGDKVGTVTVLYNNEKLTAANLVASQDVPLYAAFYQQQWFQIAAIIVGAAAVIFLIILLIRKLRNRHRKMDLGSGRSRRWSRYSSRHSRSRSHSSKNGYHNYH